MKRWNDEISFIELTPATQVENVKCFRLEKGDYFNFLFPACTNFSFLLLFGLTLRLELFPVYFDIFKTLSK